MRTAFDRRRKWIAAFVGFHGFGKTTQAERLCEALGVPRVKKTLWAQDVKLPKAGLSPRENYQQLLGYTDRFLAEALLPSLEQHGLAVLDGFPRHREEFEALRRLAQQEQVDVFLFHLHHPDQDAARALSLRRQCERAAERGLSIQVERYQGKIALTDDQLSFLGEVEAAGWRLIPLEATDSRLAIHEEVRRTLRLSFESLPWNRTLLGHLRAVDPEAYLVAGHFYRPFFNGVFGPMQESIPAVVGVMGEKHRQWMEIALARQAPEVRWRVRDIEAITAQRDGRQIQNLPEGLSLSRQLIGLSGGVRLRADDTVELHYAPGAEAHLRRGLLVPAPEGDPGQARDLALELVQQYPALNAPFIGYVPQLVIPNWAGIEAACRAMEHGGFRRWRGLSSEERQIADTLVQFSREAPTTPHAPPIPPPATLPDQFPWDATDASFREWLIQGLRGGDTHADPLVAHASMLQANAPQKPTHQGWMTHQHMFWALLGLETDGFPSYRRCLRVALLFHDLGKTVDIHSPGAHPRIGAKRWLSHAPDWLNPEEKELISYLILNHDLLGRLALGVKFPDYKGAVDPGYVRGCLHFHHIAATELLGMILALNRADVGAVATLRWTLPELDYAAKMVFPS